MNFQFLKDIFIGFFTWNALYVMSASVLTMIIGLKVLIWIAKRFGPSDED